MGPGWQPFSLFSLLTTTGEQKPVTLVLLGFQNNFQSFYSPLTYIHFEGVSARKIQQSKKVKITFSLNGPQASSAFCPLEDIHI